MQSELRDIFKTRTSAEWLEFSNTVNTPIAPVNTPKTIADDPQFQDRFPWIPASRLGADEMPLPLKITGEELPVPTRAPKVGEHTDDVLASVLGYDDARIKALHESGALGG
jgi:crotonobetainyl-CoA:carnitine CoA-transferase CaiB-like acyl-CoA transferase